MVKNRDRARRAPEMGGCAMPIVLLWYDLRRSGSIERMPDPLPNTGRRVFTHTLRYPWTLYGGPHWLLRDDQS